MASGRFATETPGNDGELVLVDEIGDTRESETSYFRRSVEEVSCNVLETKKFPEILTTDRIDLL